MEKQPAKVNYFFHDGYVDFKNTVVETFSECGSGIRERWDDTKDNFEELVDSVMGLDIGDIIKYSVLFGLAVGRLLFITIVTPILSLVLSLLQGTAMISVMIPIYIMFCLMAFADWLYRSIKKISTSCPNCQNKFDLPSYQCECGAIHTRLIPSKYGILFRTCNCGRKLRTTFFNGRHKQDGAWICPKCSYELSGALQVDIPIPVVGGPSSGKTCFISMAISQIEKNASTYGLEFNYNPNEALGDDYESNIQNMEKGKLPQKTSDLRLRYYQFYLTPKGERVKNLISICDVAGETYQQNDEIAKQIGFKNANAFLIIIDPLSLRKYCDEVGKSIDLSKYGASDSGIDEVVDILINNLQNFNCATPKKMMKTDIAIVFTKCDIPGLADKIGETAVNEYMKEHNDATKYEAINKVCERFLIEYEEENFLNTLKSKFKSIQFFTCSALGHIVDGSDFDPNGVEEPALWLIDKASASINLRQKWGKKI